MRTFTLACALASIVVAAHATCSCEKQPKTVQEAFCQAEWAMQAIVNFETTNDDKTEITYHVTRIGAFYKYPQGKPMSLLVSHEIVTSNDPDQCGEKLKLAGNYILLGTFDEKDRFHIDSCLTLPVEEGTHNPFAAEVLKVPFEVRNDLLLNKITCEAQAGAGTSPRPSSPAA